jgi:hypothetical protein
MTASIKPEMPPIPESIMCEILIDALISNARAKQVSIKKKLWDNPNPNIPPLKYIGIACRKVNGNDMAFICFEDREIPISAEDIPDMIISLNIIHNYIKR